PAARSTILMKPLIKILDWGLASLRGPSGWADEAALENARSIVGTADYLSPEQARDAGAADIRRDIYSLGCSPYYLRTPQAPLPAGGGRKKMGAQQRAGRRPMEDFRREVARGVADVVRRMRAKRPEERFQTPASVAMALLSFPRRSSKEQGSSCTLPALRGI